MTIGDQQNPDSELRPPITLRPTGHPVLAALEDDVDPGRSFLRLVRETLDPGEWVVETADGFWWIPYQLRHTVELITDGHDGPPRVRSTFAVVDEIEDLAQALELVHYLNQRPFGCAIWVDAETSSIFATSSVQLDPRSWWNAIAFYMTLPRLVSILERLAPRLAGLSSGRVPIARHPDLGVREDPDQLFFEHLHDTYAPEAATGLWFAPRELDAIWRTVHYSIAQPGEVPAEPDDYRVSVSANDNLCLTFPWRDSDRVAELRIQTANHPDLGRGLEFLTTIPLRIDPLDPEPDVPRSSPDAKFVTNAMNKVEADVCPGGLVLGGWSTWRSQIHRSVFLSGEVTRTLLSLSTTRCGEVVGLMATNASSLWTVGLLESNNWIGSRVERTDERLWRGVEQNGGYHSLLCDDAEAVNAVLPLISLNSADEPVEVDGEVWALQHSQLIAVFGIFNPAGPTITSLELAINYATGRGLLLERTRHPFSPSLRLHAVLDRDGFNDLDTYVSRAVGALGLLGIDWCEIVTEDSDLVAAVIAGIREWASRSDVDLLAEAALLNATHWSPWVRLTEPSSLLVNPPPLEADAIDYWTRAVTRIGNIDNHVAFLRSAWEGAIRFAQGDFKEAQAISSQIAQEIDLRRNGNQDNQGSRSNI